MRPDARDDDPGLRERYALTIVTVLAAVVAGYFVVSCYASVVARIGAGLP